MPLTTTPQAGRDKRLSGLSVTGRLHISIESGFTFRKRIVRSVFYPRATLKNETRSFLYYLSVYVNLSKNNFCCKLKRRAEAQSKASLYRRKVNINV